MTRPREPERLAAIRPCARCGRDVWPMVLLPKVLIDDLGTLCPRGTEGVAWARHV